MAKAQWDFAVDTDSATYDIPMSTIKRTLTKNNDYEKARFEVAAISWADVSTEDHGVSLITRLQARIQW